MDVPASLKWKKEGHRYAAYLLGDILPDRLACIAPHIGAYNSWKWVVNWEGWFTECGIATGKQEAADKATEAWWSSVQKDVPRDVDFEATSLVARVLVRPMPNSLLADDAEIVQSVLWHLRNVHREEIASGTAPAAVLNLAEQLAAQVERRVATDEITAPITVVPQKMRRRRR